MFNEFMMMMNNFEESNDSIFKGNYNEIKWKRKKFLKLTLKVNKQDRGEWMVVY